MNMFLFCTLSSGMYIFETNHYYYTGFRKQTRYPAEEKSVVGSYDKLCEKEEERITVKLEKVDTQDFQSCTDFMHSMDLNMIALWSMMSFMGFPLMLLKTTLPY